VEIDVSRDGKARHAVLTAQAGAPLPRSLKLMIMTSGSVGLVALLFSCVLLIRGWRNRSAVLLAGILVGLAYGIPTSFLPHGAVAVLRVLGIAMSAASIGLFPLFCLSVSGGPKSARQNRLVNGVSAALFVAAVYLAVGDMLPVALPLGFPGARGVLRLVDQLYGYSILAANYARNDALGRNRIRIVAVAFACQLATALAFNAQDALAAAGGNLDAMLPLGLTASVFAGAFVALLVYAVLASRLFDLGFAINRTLVYAAVSFVVLASFGLAEWAADRVIPETWREGSVLFSAGTAVILFLSFHRLRDWFEHHVSRLFFHRWQENEAELKRFVASAGHFEQAPALCRGFAAALARFAGSETAVYLRGSDGIYRLQCGGCAGTPDKFADDDPAFALMRAERSPLDLTRLDAALPGALALPMLDQATLTGFVLLGAKRDGAHYRPDEVDNLGWAAHQVGLDLQALHARELEAENATLREKVAWLTAPQRSAKPRALKAVPGGAAG
jgi:hypothetical protein